MKDGRWSSKNGNEIREALDRAAARINVEAVEKQIVQYFSLSGYATIALTLLRRQNRSARPMLPQIEKRENTKLHNLLDECLGVTPAEPVRDN